MIAENLFFLRLILACLYILRIDGSDDCSPVYIDETTGSPDIKTAVYNCSNNIWSARLPNSYQTNQKNFTVYSQIVLNNLISINDIDRGDRYARFQMEIVMAGPTMASL